MAGGFSVEWNEGKLIFSEKAVWPRSLSSHLIFLPRSYGISHGRVSHHFAEAHIWWGYLSPFSLMVCFASLMVSKWYRIPCSFRSPHAGDDLRGQNHIERLPKQSHQRYKASPPFCLVMSMGRPYLQCILVPDLLGELLPTMHRTADIAVTFHCSEPCTGILKFLSVTNIYLSVTQAEPSQTKWLNLFYCNKWSGHHGRSRWSSTVSKNKI